MEYEKMLDRLYMSLPKEALSKERFELPEVQSHIQGTKTVVSNFNQLLKSINRPQKHLLKFLTNESGTSAVVEENRLTINGKFSQQQVTKLFETYLKQFVLCPECNKPDTKTIDHQGIKMLKCTACGAISPLKRL